MMSAAGKNDGKKEFGERDVWSAGHTFLYFQRLRMDERRWKQSIVKSESGTIQKWPTHRFAIKTTSYTSWEPISVLPAAKMVGTKWPSYFTWTEMIGWNAQLEIVPGFENDFWIDKKNDNHHLWWIGSFERLIDCVKYRWRYSILWTKSKHHHH